MSITKIEAPSPPVTKRSVVTGMRDLLEREGFRLPHPAYPTEGLTPAEALRKACERRGARHDVMEAVLMQNAHAALYPKPGTAASTVIDELEDLIDALDPEEAKERAAYDARCATWIREHGVAQWVDEWSDERAYWSAHVGPESHHVDADKVLTVVRTDRETGLCRVRTCPAEPVIADAISVLGGGWSAAEAIVRIELDRLARACEEGRS